MERESPRKLNSACCNCSAAEYKGHLVPRNGYTLIMLTFTATPSYLHTPSTEACAGDISTLHHMDRGGCILSVSNTVLEGRTEIAPWGVGRLLAFKTLSQEGSPLGRRNESEAIQRGWPVSFPSLGHAQHSCHPVARKEHCSNHLV